MAYRLINVDNGLKKRDVVKAKQSLSEALKRIHAVNALQDIGHFTVDITHPRMMSKRAVVVRYPLSKKTELKITPSVSPEAIIHALVHVKQYNRESLAPCSQHGGGIIWHKQWYEVEHGHQRHSPRWHYPWEVEAYHMELKHYRNKFKRWCRCVYLRYKGVPILS